MPLHYIDIAIAVVLPVTVYVLVRKGKAPARAWPLFWIGCAIALSWELTFHFLGPEYSDNPLFSHVNPWPLAPILQPLLHTLWDGGLFMAGYALCFLLLRGPRFRRFSAAELFIMVAWGSLQALVVELIGSQSLWVYNPRPYNPVMFHFSGQPITLLPQLVWAVAPVLFYLACLWMHGRDSGKLLMEPVSHG